MVLKTVADDAAARAPAVTQWVVFRCGGQRYGMPLERVREIVSPRPFTRLPGAGPEVPGLAGVRGRIVTVVDLGTLLHGQPAAHAADHRLLLLDLGGRLLGAVVDDVVMIAPASVSPPTDSASDDAVPGAAGTGVLEDGAFIALDPARLLEGVLPWLNTLQGTG
jgi:purine-binding chemotaxis protein CheW